MCTHPIKALMNAACRVYAVCTILLCLVILLFGGDELVVAPLPFILLFPFLEQNSYHQYFGMFKS